MLEHFLLFVLWPRQSSFLHFYSMSGNDDFGCPMCRQLVLYRRKKSRNVELISLSISTGYDTAILVSNCISLDIVFIPIRDVEISPTIHDQSITVNLANDHFISRSLLASGPSRGSLISTISNQDTICLFVDEDIRWIM